MKERVRKRYIEARVGLWRRVARRPVSRLYHEGLVIQTKNFTDTTWLGQPILQNVLDLWTIQETIAEIRPALLVEIGTNRGGSALFFAHLMDLMGHGRVLTIDIERLHSLDHPRIEFVLGDSVSDAVVSRVRDAA